MSVDDTINPELLSTLNPDWLHVQLNNYDYYTAKPLSLDTKHGSSLPMNQFLQVPTIRIFGNLPTGHQVLCHVHGVFPYFFIRYDGKHTDNTVAINQKCAQLHILLETWCELLATKKQSGKNVKEATLPNGLKHIANVSVVKGIPFYGYHVGWSLFYKVSLLNVSLANKLNDAIRDGKVFGKQVDCYESQLPYLLQFTTDFNLFCCSWIDLGRCYFRSPILNTTLELDKLLYTETLEELIQKFCEPESNLLPSKEYPRMGNGLIEIDIIPQFIRNIEDLQFRDIHHNFIELLNGTSELLRKPYVTSTKNIVKDIALHRKILSLSPYTPASPVERFSHGDKWQSSKEHQDAFVEAKRRLSTRSCQVLPDVESFIQNTPNLDNIKTPRDALSELWPVVNETKILQALNNDANNIIDTIDHDYSLAYLSDDEYRENEGMMNLNEKRDSNSPPSIESESSLTEENISKQSIFKRTSIDLSLTQSMAKKIKSAGIVSDARSSVGQIREMNSCDGIKYEKGSYRFKSCLLSYDMILKDLENEGFPKVDYLEPYFSNPLDLKQKPYVYAGKRFEITSTHLISRIPVPFEDENIGMDTTSKGSVFSSWRYLKKPPLYTDVLTYSASTRKRRPFRSLIEDPASVTKFYCNSDRAKKQSQSLNGKPLVHNSLNHFSMEVHVQTSGSKIPDPQKDEVQMICWCLEKETFPHDLDLSFEGVMIVKDPHQGGFPAEMLQQAVGETPVAFYQNEFDLFDALIDLVMIFDPDILSGFEVHNASWGYIIERCRKAHHFEIAEEFSRVNRNIKSKFKDAWGYSHASGIIIPGRHLINVWRALRAELNLTQYTIENISYKVLQKRLPHFTFQILSEMWKDNKDISKIKTVISYWLTRCRLNISLLQKQEYIPRIREQARLTGIDFYSVYYRGSQYKIESILSRICKAESFILLAPSRKQVQKQKALECVPLVMEPESGFYKSPLVVLDFQSLYPSIMIAHNYCYSTLIGRVAELKTNDNEIGVTKIPLRRNILALLEDHINIAPNGLAFVDSSVRKSTLAKMLEDILDTRFTVKKTMSELGSLNVSLKKLLNSKQLALKLIANVTYGYTSASFSGRMPCSDLADSIVQTGREILEKAIELIESNLSWGAKVVYGDTDSLFVYLPGKTRSEAFRIGQEMAKSITSRNRAPIYLNFEKVYHPCLLLSKKRYVGFKYERDSKKSRTFDAKGIETVRRDGHPAQQKITEKSLRILFETKDLSQVKYYVQSEFIKIHSGHITLQDFCFAKEVKLGSYKSEKTAPPGAHVAARQIENDHRDVPQYKERVPYVVVRGQAGQLLRDRCLSPSEYLAEKSLELDSEYYINKTLVPPLERLFNVLGISVAEWAFEVPRNMKIQNKFNLRNVLGTVAFTACVNCKEENDNDDSVLCDKCLANSKRTAANLILEKSSEELNLKNMSTICRTCCFKYSHDPGIITDEISNNCSSYDCPVYYSKIKSKRYFQSTKFLNIQEALKCINHW